MSSFAERWHLALGLRSLVVGVLVAAASTALRRVVTGLPGSSPLGPAAPWCCGLALVGLWATVPDTELPLVVAAVTAPTLLLCAAGRTSVGRVGLAAVLGLGLVAAVVGSGGRGAALAGAACCLVGPATGLLPAPRGAGVSPGLVVAAHTVAIVVGSRLVAHAEPALAVPVAAAVVGLAVVTSQRWLPVADSG